MNNNDQYFESYVPVYDDVPQEWEEARIFFVEQLKKISNSVNIKTIGWLLDEELLSGQNFIPSVGNQEFRSVLRKVVDFGPLPNSGTKVIPHGITFNDFILINLWAMATEPGLHAIPIPYAGSTPIQIYLDNVNIVITTTDIRSQYTKCYVFIEYIQEP